MALYLLNNNASSASDSSLLPRNEIVQKLSVLLSCLDSVLHPDHKNYATCNKPRAILKCMLDRILAPKLDATLMDTQPASAYGMAPPAMPSMEVEDYGMWLSFVGVDMPTPFDNSQWVGMEPVEPSFFDNSARLVGPPR